MDFEVFFSQEHASIIRRFQLLFTGNSKLRAAKAVIDGGAERASADSSIWLSF